MGFILCQTSQCISLLAVCRDTLPGHALTAYARLNQLRKMQSPMPSLPHPTHHDTPNTPHRHIFREQSRVYYCMYCTTERAGRGNESGSSGASAAAKATRRYNRCSLQRGGLLPACSVFILVPPLATVSLSLYVSLSLSLASLSVCASLVSQPVFHVNHAAHQA